MSPELERLLAALYEQDHCEPGEQAKWDATVQRLINDALSRQAGITRDQFMDALETRYREFRRARRKPPTLPPSA